MLMRAKRERTRESQFVRENEGEKGGKRQKESAWRSARSWLSSTTAARHLAPTWVEGMGAV